MSIFNISNGVGGLRFLSSYLLSGNDTNEEYIKWIERDTEQEKANAEADFNAWYERTFEDGDWDKGMEAYEILIRWVATCEQSAFEDGMRTGARITLELLGKINPRGAI